MTDEMRKDFDLIKEYINSRAPEALKEPKSPLKHSFIDPGSVYDGNLWDWDSYWALYGLTALEDGILPVNWFDHGRGNVLNFLDHQLEDGYVPMLIETHKDEKVPYLNRKHLEGKVMNMHKPFLCQQTLLVSRKTDDFSWTVPLMEGLEKYFSCYDHYYLNHKTRLYVWADDVMIGMDNDPASFGRPGFSTANIFLNSFMVRELESMAELCGENGLPERQNRYLTKAEGLKRAVQRECWDTRDNFFYSVDVDVETRAFDWFHEGLGVFWNSLPIRIQVWSGFLPLWAGFADKKQAEAMKNHDLREESFFSPSGVRTLSREERMYDLRATNNPSNWLGPVWIVASYCVFRGLLNYGYKAEAEDLAARTFKLLADDLRKTGTLHEYYNPETSEPVMNSGFLNWNMLVLNMADEL
ncbi:MAG: trehalase family glycosidase [Spirochaetales bacterium]|nr:trehalase family glycosidase [Spirochaetales bacterium]